jgi:hypothetical protein
MCWITLAGAVSSAEISFSQGAEWKALVNTYIQTIPFNGDASCAGERGDHRVTCS